MLLEKCMTVRLEGSAGVISFWQTLITLTRVRVVISFWQILITAFPGTRGNNAERD